jgi:hypothetical protein
LNRIFIVALAAERVGEPLDAPDRRLAVRRELRSNFKTPVAGDRTLAQPTMNERQVADISDRCGPGVGDVDGQADSEDELLRLRDPGKPSGMAIDADFVADREGGAHPAPLLTRDELS